MEEMLVVLVLYSVWVSAVLVWSTLLDESRISNPQLSRDGFEYVAIPEQSFLELMQQQSNLVIFDVHAERGASGWSELISYWLPISAVDLPRVLKWLPPASTVVFAADASLSGSIPELKRCCYNSASRRSIPGRRPNLSAESLVTWRSQQTQPIEKCREEH
jgi:hypothetical protein